jgi:hypothetical protein
VAETIYVLPLSEEPERRKWRWRVGEDGKESRQFSSRSEAFEDALLERTDENIVLLKADGSVHGELYHSQPGDPGEPQRADILAATSRDGASDL